MNDYYEYVKEYNRTQYEDIGLQFKTAQHVNARYIRSFDSMDNGNRLIEALPPIRSEEDCVYDFVRIPCWTPEVRRRSKMERMQMCAHLREYRTPRDFTCDVDFKIRDLITRCYRAKIPNECPGSTGAGFYCVSGETVSGGLLVGDSGAGKTTAILHSLQYYPQLIVHDMGDSRMLQIPYINVLCPPDASVKGFYDLCLNEIERITGQPISERDKRSTADKKAQIFRRQAARFNIGLVVVDEVQNIMNVQKKTLMQHFLNISNELSVPFLFVGTPEVKTFFESEKFRIKRRTGEFLQASYFQKDEIWEEFLQSLWEYQWTKEIIPFSQEFSNVFFQESAGNIDRVKELFVVTQIEAIKNERDTIKCFTPEFVREISHKHFEISFKELNKRAEIPQPLKELLIDNRTFHEKEEVNRLIAHATNKKEQTEILKYKVVENVGIFTKGNFRLPEIEKAFDKVAKEMDVLKAEEVDVSMRTVQILLVQAERKPVDITRKTKKQGILMEEFAKDLPMFEGLGV